MSEKGRNNNNNNNNSDNPLTPRRNDGCKKVTRNRRRKKGRGSKKWERFSKLSPDSYVRVDGKERQLAIANQIRTSKHMIDL